MHSNSVLSLYSAASYGQRAMNQGAAAFFDDMNILTLYVVMQPSTLHDSSPADGCHYGCTGCPSTPHRMKRTLLQ